MTSRLFLVLTILVALIALSHGLFHDPCLVNKDCTDCLKGNSKTHCGWCESTGQCLTGNSNGPGGLKGNCSEWLFSSCVTNPCPSHKTCDSCARDPFCIWCLSTGNCVEGDSHGPTSGKCSKFVNNTSQCQATTTTGSRPPPPPPPPPATTTGRSTTGRAPSSQSNSPARPPPPPPPPVRPSNPFHSSSSASSLFPSTAVFVTVVLAALVYLF